MSQKIEDDRENQEEEREFEKSQSHERASGCENLHSSVTELGMARDERNKQVVERHQLLLRTLSELPIHSNSV